jgi:hypothetical protein
VLSALLLAFSSLVVAACSPNAMMARIVPPERDARARRYLGMLTTGQHDSILTHARFGSDAAAVATGLAQLDSIFLGQRLDSMQLVGANLFSSNGRERLDVAYEFRTQQGWNVASFVTVDSGTEWVIDGIRANRIPAELKKLNAFTLVGRSATHYAVLVLTVAIAAFSLGMAVFMATRRTFPKRWRWVLAALVGVASLKMNWTTGEMATDVFHVQLFGASVLKSGDFAPWIVSFSFPLGAIMAWERYRRWRDRPAVLPTPADAVASPDADLIVRESGAPATGDDFQP